MSIQTKKGFTLIELMVVIVIIGILAAIAIPKLFGMSAKAKASEVGPAAGTYIKMQMAYKVEKSEYGDKDQIGYVLPGDQSGKSNSFQYNVGQTPNYEWTAVASFSADVCGGPAGTWEVSVASNSFTTTPGCKALTPSFEDIGKGNSF